MRKKILFLALLISLGVIGYYFITIKERKIKAHLKITSANVVDWKGSKATLDIDFKFVFHGDSVNGNCNTMIAGDVVKYFYINRLCVPVVYDTTDPTNAMLLFTEEDFSLFGLSYPDTMKQHLSASKRNY